MAADIEEAIATAGLALWRAAEVRAGKSHTFFLLV